MVDIFHLRIRFEYLRCNIRITEARMLNLGIQADSVKKYNVSTHNSKS